jgi:hypothetical protein
MKATLLGIAIAWCLVALIIGLVMLGDYNPGYLAVVLVTAFGGGIGFACTLPCHYTFPCPYQGYL